MAKKRIVIIVMLFCMCIHGMSYCVQAANTSDATEPIVSKNKCSLTVSYCYAETAFSNVEVKLYRIADVSADFQYTLTLPFKSSGLILNGLQSAGEWNVIRSTLEAYIVANRVGADVVSLTNEDGRVRFTQLDTGLYLAVAGQVQQGDLICDFDSALIALPGLGQDGVWEYQVLANAKGEAVPPIDPDTEIQLKVLKLWKGDDGSDARPQSVEVEIFCNGVGYETVVLSEENHWSYSWIAKEDGANWTVAEKNIPQGYTMTVEERKNSFVLTNTWNSEDPDTPPSQTGDKTLSHILLMAMSGCLLVILGVSGKRRRV